MSETPHRAGRRIVLIGGLIALALVIAVQATRPRPAILGSNGIRPQEFVAVIPADRMLCQSAQELPRDTGALTMTIGTYYRPGPPLQVLFRDEDGLPLARGSLRAGWRQGVVTVPLDRATRRDIGDVRLCLMNGGRHDIAIGGSVTSRRDAARIGRRVADGRISALYVSRRRQSGFEAAERSAEAMDGPGLWGGAAPWVAVALGGLAVFGVVRTLW